MIPFVIRVTPSCIRKTLAWRATKDNINLITLQNILNNGKPDFIERLANTALLYQKLNNEGIDKAIGQIELIARIPECQYHK